MVLCSRCLTSYPENSPACPACGLKGGGEVLQLDRPRKAPAPEDPPPAGPPFIAENPSHSSLRPSTRHSQPRVEPDPQRVSSLPSIAPPAHEVGERAPEERVLWTTRLLDVAQQITSSHHTSLLALILGAALAATALTPWFLSLRNGWFFSPFLYRTVPLFSIATISIALYAGALIFARAMRRLEEDPGNWMVVAVVPFAVLTMGMLFRPGDLFSIAILGLGGAGRAIAIALLIGVALRQSRDEEELKIEPEVLLIGRITFAVAVIAFVIPVRMYAAEDGMSRSALFSTIRGAMSGPGLNTIGEGLRQMLQFVCLVAGGLAWHDRKLRTRMNLDASSGKVAIATIVIMAELAQPLLFIANGVVGGEEVSQFLLLGAKMLIAQVALLLALLHGVNLLWPRSSHELSRAGNTSQH